MPGRAGVAARSVGVSVGGEQGEYTGPMHEQGRAYGPARGAATLGRWPAPRGRPYDLAELVGGQVLQTPAGSCLLVERRYPLGHRHGLHALETARALDSRALA